MYVMYVHIATSICFDIRGSEVRRSTEDHGEVFGMRALYIIIIIVYPVIDSDELVYIYNGLISLFVLSCQWHSDMQSQYAYTLP